MKILKKWYLLVIVCIFIVITIIVVLKSNNNNPFLGTWLSEGGTIYEFNKNGKGMMKTTLSEYNFSYKISKKVLSIDFEDEKAIDTDYNFICSENSKCTLTSDRGTFTFNKK